MKISLSFYGVMAAFVLSGSASAFECRKPVDPKRAVVFIDANFGLKEMYAAEKAACDRGESFVRIPEATPGEDVALREFERLSVLETRMEKLEDEAEVIDCPLTDEATTDPRCQAMIEKHTRFAEEFDRLTISTDAFIKKLKAANSGSSAPSDSVVYGMVQRGAKAIAARGIRPTAIIVSGHSSGSSVGGRFGWMMLTSLQSLIVEAYANSKELLTDLKSLYLMGCNTLNPHVPEKWISVFPTIDLILGFEGSAPSNLMDNSWEMLEGTLRQESAILARAASFSSESEVEKTFTAIPGVDDTVAAFYLHDRVGDRKWIYERTLDKNERGMVFWNVRATEILSAKDCAPLSEQIKADQAYIDSILSGVTEISRESGSGSLREAYTRARRNDVCRELLGYSHGADRIGLLLFWHGVKRNAMRALDSSKIETVFADALKNPNEVLKNVENANAATSAHLRERRENLEKDQKKYDASIFKMQQAISTALAAESLLPWTKARKKEYRRLLRQKKRFERKLKKGKIEKEALEALEIRVRNYGEAKRLSNPGTSSGLTSYRESLSVYEKALANVRKSLADLGSTPGVVDADAFLADLRAFIRNAHPKSVEEITPMSYAEVLNLHRVRKGALERIEKALTTSGVYMNSYLPLLTTAKNWQTRYEETVVLPRSECMYFLPWHEYIESQPSGERPYYACHYSI